MIFIYKYRILFVTVVIWFMLGCTSHKVIMPTMDLPPEPQKPAIKTVIVPYQNDIVVGYRMDDSLRLYEFLLRKDSYEEKLRYRIDTMNQLLIGKSMTN